jgi:hypothetical protein
LSDDAYIYTGLTLADFRKKMRLWENRKRKMGLKIAKKMGFAS